MKTFHVQTFSHVKAIQVVRAESAEEALQMADKAMKESLLRKMQEVDVHPDLVSMRGHAGAEGTPIEI